MRAIQTVLPPPPRQGVTVTSRGHPRNALVPASCAWVWTLKLCLGPELTKCVDTGSSEVLSEVTLPLSYCLSILLPGPHMLMNCPLLVLSVVLFVCLRWGLTV